jgi:putative spermidine/putrescine transport system substrate-binding protein
MKARTILIGAALLLAAFLLFYQPFGEKEAEGSLVVASWGGSFQDAQREVLFEPFTEETGIRIIETTGPSLAKSRPWWTAAAPSGTSRS